MSKPVLAAGESVTIPLMDGYFTEQFELNETIPLDALRYYQVYDRTANAEVPRVQWSYADGR